MTAPLRKFSCAYLIKSATSLLAIEKTEVIVHKRHIIKPVLNIGTDFRWSHSWLADILGLIHTQTRENGNDYLTEIKHDHGQKVAKQVSRNITTIRTSTWEFMALTAHPEQIAHWHSWSSTKSTSTKVPHSHKKRGSSLLRDSRATTTTSPNWEFKVQKVSSTFWHRVSPLDDKIQIDTGFMQCTEF